MALNYTVLMGRITNDLEVKQTQSGVACLQFNIAVERNFKNSNGEYDTDFITCVAWRETCEFIAKYFSKGKMIAVEGQLRSRTYEDKNGTKHYITEVYVDSASFTGEKSQNQNSGFGGFGG
jgi:single-strand DNA-binding protein